MSDQQNSNTPSFDEAANLRRSIRVQVDIPVQIFTNTFSCAGRGHELGIVGMAVHVPIDLHEGDQIRIMFQPPNSKARFGLFGRIRNRENFRYGIEFLELGSAESTELTRVINSLKPTSSVAS
jgi:hypothetical protein